MGCRLRRHAESTQHRITTCVDEPFVPECLTLYQHNECNLNCSYCYAKPSALPSERLDLETIAAAAKCVARGCAERGLPFHAVFHGGGEPALYPDLVEAALAVLHRTARSAGLPLFTYIATNGAVPADTAAWLARNFDLIGLSCDGPPDIQDIHRPRRDGASTSTAVERTARILREEGVRFHVRTTVTRHTLHRQPEIAEYLCTRLSPEALRFEPVYQHARAQSRSLLQPEHASQFIEGFLHARDIAARHGASLSLSGTRPASLHGPYCNVFRAVLNLVPGGVATACFRAGTQAAVEAAGMVIGRMNRQSRQFEIDGRRIADLRRRLLDAPDQCNTCFNRYHCVRDCPDRCPLTPAPDPVDDPVANPAAGFRCRVQRMLAYVHLRDAADVLWKQLETARAHEKGDPSRHDPHATVCGTTQL